MANDNLPSRTIRREQKLSTSAMRADQFAIAACFCSRPRAAARRGRVAQKGHPRSPRCDPGAHMLPNPCARTFPITADTKTATTSTGCAVIQRSSSPKVGCRTRRSIIIATNRLALGVRACRANLGGRWVTVDLYCYETLRAAGMFDIDHAQCGLTATISWRGAVQRTS